MLFEFVRESFRKWFIALLWITFLGFTLTGIIFGWIFGSLTLSTLLPFVNSVLGGIIGAIIGCGLGLLIGAFVIIIGGGLIATFLNIDEKITKIQKDINGLKK